jgi:hypothetical protein
VPARTAGLSRVCSILQDDWDLLLLYNHFKTRSLPLSVLTSKMSGTYYYFTIISRPRSLPLSVLTSKMSGTCYYSTIIEVNT